MSQRDPLRWKLAAFDALSPHELYALLQLRTEVFVMEQNCPFQDMDGTDEQALHLMGSQGEPLLAYARCFPAGSQVCRGQHRARGYAPLRAVWAWGIC